MVSKSIINIIYKLIIKYLEKYDTETYELYFDILQKQIENKIIKFYNKPPRLLSAYNHFCKEQFSFINNIKDISLKWNQLDTDTKQKYNLSEKKIKISKRPKSAYNFFVIEQYPIIKQKLQTTNQNININILSIIGRLWSLTPDRSKYQEQAQKEREKYNYKKKKKIDNNIDYIIDSILNDTNIDKKNNTNIDKKSDTNIDKKSDTNIDKKNDTNIDKKFDTNIDKKSDTNIDKKNNTNIDKKSDTNIDLYINYKQKYIEENIENYMEEHQENKKKSIKELGKIWDEMDEDEQEEFIKDFNNK